MRVCVYIISVIITFIAVPSLGQNFVRVHGTIKDSDGKALEYVNISGPDNTGTSSDSRGKYSFKVPAGKRAMLIFSHLEHFNDTVYIPIDTKEEIRIDIRMKKGANILSEVDINVVMEDASRGMDRIPPKIIEVIPTTSQGIEAALIGQLGVSKSGGELSSQYSVRGGNFDENMVYVNDIEVYRPFLVRSGQQEGLSFANPDMVQSILFSAGGFEAKYGDKMSSVLDITYRKPKEFAASVSASLLGGSLHLEGGSKNHRFTHISGLRYKTSKYMLGSLETEGEYAPSFIDFQTFMTYDVTEKFELSFLGNYAQNKYEFVPETLETAWGTVNESLNLKVYFDGQEMDRFETFTGALSGNYRPNAKQVYKFIASAFTTNEEETYDIQGQYFINELDRNLGSESLGDSLMNIGIGTFLNHARNYLNATVINFSHKGYISNTSGRNLLQWGVKYQYEIINDDINEWQMLDSAGYTLPYSDTSVDLYYTLNTKNAVNSNRGTFYLQNSYTFTPDSNKINLIVGVRGHYWDFSNQFVFGPRLNFSFTPNWKRRFMFRVAGGYYYQPPFYKEMRDIDGNINSDIKAQQSIHAVVGLDYYFKLWGRPFKFVAEAYYKYFDHLIPYTIDQVRIRYYAHNDAYGYATGVDVKINGEFVKGVDSWASLSYMRTMENVAGDVNTVKIPMYTTDTEGNIHDISYYETVDQGMVERPSNQTITLGLFFQDYIPKHPDYKVHLSLMFGSGLPFGAPKSYDQRTAFQMPQYRRVDIGFSKQIVGKDSKWSHFRIFKPFKSMWISLEIFNLLNISNTISYLWVTDIYSRQLAVPNYLTSRRVNVKLISKF